MRIGNLVNLYLSSTADFNSCGGWWTVWYEEIISKLFSLSLLIMAVCFINIERNIVAFIILIWMTRVPSCRCSGLFSWFSLFLESFFNYFNATVKPPVCRKEGGGGRAIIWFLLFSFMGPQYDLCRALEHTGTYFPLYWRNKNSQ